MESTSLALLGAGNMGQAILRGLISKKTLAPENILITCRRPGKAEALAESHGVRWSETNLAAAEQADVVLLGVKPQAMCGVLEEIAPVSPSKLLISVAAGLSTSRLETWAGGAHAVRVVRAMPNTPAKVGAAATALARGRHAADLDLDVAERLFASIGRTVRLDEEHLDAVTGLSGSGPAYVFLILEAFADAGVKVGLSREIAQDLATQTLLGAARMVLETGEHPGRLKDQVTSPGGTAIAGLHVLEAGGLRTTIMDAVEAATRRANELGAAPK
ncbi:MAG: pyrroline-5-carboxylate reductase [Myxococcota bacterium]